MADYIDTFSDLAELGIEINESDSLTNQFNKATKHVQSIASTLSNEILLELYGYYKQAMEGPCNVPKPSGWFDMKGKAKWDAWKKLGDMSKEEAKSLYIENVMKVDKKFDVVNEKQPTESWVKVSSFATEDKQSAKDITTFIRENDLESVKKYLQANSNKINAIDSDGMGLIHYAADIGSQDVLELLLSNNAEVNLKDSEGQTALHYASSCGHIDCVKLLLIKGADKDMVNSDGCTPEDVACDDQVKELFK